uniref:Uncharacterized protein n=1 Tax=Oryza sativa subsp. japonica TaxID=39947 RepID=Q109E8_ORYSJ|nr:hypothetical protein LOC_Os10g36984 [Oryza sativa Japonica Group]
MSSIPSSCLSFLLIWVGRLAGRLGRKSTGRAGKGGGSAAVAGDLRCGSGDDHAGAGWSAEQESDGRSDGGSCAHRTDLPEGRASGGRSRRRRGLERPTSGAARAVAGGRLLLVKKNGWLITAHHLLDNGFVL